VIILDENTLDGQRLILEGWKIAARQVGLDVGRKGLRDEQIVILLRRLRQPTFVTRDQGFYSAELRHQHYAIVVAAVGQYELAAFVRRLLHHREFDTFAKRAGKIIPIAPAASRGGSCGDNKRRLRPGKCSTETALP
jgi:hypothetical protein